MSNPYNKFVPENNSDVIVEATKTINALVKKVDALQEENTKLKNEIKQLKWRLHVQD